jgi:hypothetical protein
MERTEISLFLHIGFLDLSDTKPYAGYKPEVNA